MTSERAVMARAAAHAGVRALRAAARRTGPRGPHGPTGTASTSDGRLVELTAAAGRRFAPYGVDVTALTCAGSHIGELWTHADTGTSTYEVVPRLDIGSRPYDTTDQPMWAAVLRVVLDDAQATAPELRVAVRRSLDPLVPGPTAAVLSGLGLVHVATFPGDLASPQAWAGEERWEVRQSADRRS